MYLSTLAAAKAGRLRGKTPTQQGGGGSDEPVPPGSGILFEDFTGRYASAPAMFAAGGCGVGTDAAGLPEAGGVYGTRWLPNSDDGCNSNNDNMVLVAPGPGGIGKWMRSQIQIASQAGYTWITRPSNVCGPMPSGGVGITFKFRIQAGGSPSQNGLKFCELFWSHVTQRIQWAADRGGIDGPRWSITLGDNPPVGGVGAVNRTIQPVGPYWEDLADGNQHRFTAIVKPNTTSTYSNTGGSESDNETYSGTSSRDGRAAIWIAPNDGTAIKIVDYQQSMVNVTPPGGTGPWCRQGDVDMIPAVSGVSIQEFHLVDVVNQSFEAFNLDMANPIIFKL